MAENVSIQEIKIIRVRAYSTAKHPAFIVVTYRDEEGLYQSVSYNLSPGDTLDISNYDACPPLPQRSM